MQFLRSGHHDDRRRRVLTDEVIGGASAAAAAPAAKETARSSRSKSRTANATPRYGDGATMDQQPRVTDLIPRKYSTFLLLFVVGLGIIAGLEALYAWMPQLASKTTDGRVAAFDLDGEGGLAVWFSSATLSSAGLVAILIYSIRRHRMDDYHAKYRVWLWAAACWFLMSIDEGASLHEGFKEMMTAVTGHRLLGDGSLWWVIPYFGLLGTIGIRLLIEVRNCRGALVSLVAVAAFYGTAVVTQLQWIMERTGSRGVMVEEGCEMVGNLFLLLTMGLYARYVKLEAEGLLPAKAKTDKKAEAKRQKAVLDATPTASVAAKRNDLEPVTKTTATTTAESRPANRYVEREEYEDEDDDRSSRKSRKHRFDDAEEDDEGDHKLSRAARKAMRKQKEQQRRGMGE